MYGGVTILTGYSANAVVPIDAIIDLTLADLHNLNKADDKLILLSLDGDEADKGGSIISRDSTTALVEINPPLPVLTPSPTPPQTR